MLTSTLVRRLDILRVDEPTKLFPEVYQPLVSLILQGEKRLLIGEQILSYGEGHAFVASIDLPAMGEVVRASEAAPYLALRLRFDPAVVADLVRQVADQAPKPDARSFDVGPMSDRLIDAWLRLLRLADHPDEIAVMAPLLEREILFHFLRSPQGGLLQQIAGFDDRFARIRKAVTWLRANYAGSLRVENLAHLVGMGASAFHRSFKANTGLSPLQYQKHLRLYEARRLLLAERSDVASVAFAVGYESASQFTREYARMFGVPPARDSRQLRAKTSPGLGIAV
ncbi:AraC family transcriptional regulator [Aureimonas psammosilenae]|uniref:AraC family transcriptional regulator n=1 Tax=Aureimonas psammosilenae TaxID=2495496 RepID=UPI001F26CE19|nr:AraC family transcriptional regulator [Aureimonas psammosilenae]